MTTSSSLDARLAVVAAEAARLAAAYLATEFRAGAAAEEKGAFHDLVTACDREAERRIAEHILREHPDSTVVGEEGGRRGTGAIEWYVDPIDGTNNFAHGIPLFSVSIAAVRDGRLVAAAICDPVREELWTATPAGAFLNGAPIRASGKRRDATALLLTDFPPDGGRATESDHAAYRALVASFQTVRRIGSTALALAYLACGRADVVLDTRVAAWDVAAGILLVERAGGRYLASPEGRAPWLAPDFVAVCAEFDLAHSAVRDVLPLTAP